MRRIYNIAIEPTIDSQRFNCGAVLANNVVHHVTLAIDESVKDVYMNIYHRTLEVLRMSIGLDKDLNIASYLQDWTLIISEYEFPKPGYSTLKQPPKTIRVSGNRPGDGWNYPRFTIYFLADKPSIVHRLTISPEVFSEE
jgi:hypothetical protein